MEFEENPNFLVKLIDSYYKQLFKGILIPHFNVQILKTKNGRMDDLYMPYNIFKMYFGLQVCVSLYGMAV